MKRLKRPERLKAGDSVAVVSLSWGGAGDADILWRYQVGKERLEEVFGLKVVEMPYVLAGSEYLYKHPEKRAQDLMYAFQDKSIRGIIACIGGEESVRILPYINKEIIANHPKIFMGYSDTTMQHLFCYKAGISSFYGANLLVDLAENVKMHPYTIEHIKRTLFTSEVIGTIEAAKEWTSEYLPWEERFKNKERTYQPNIGYELLQGEGIVIGRLLGGCLEVFSSARGTEYFPNVGDFDDTILFFETSQEQPSVWFIENELRFLGISGILDRVRGMIWGKPKDEKYYREYKIAICKVMKEFHREDMPILYNLNFGHTEPKCCLPYGILAQINCEEKKFTILQPGVL